MLYGDESYDRAVKRLVKVELNYGKFKLGAPEQCWKWDRPSTVKAKNRAIEKYKEVVKKFLGTDEANVARELLQNHRVYIDE